MKILMISIDKGLLGQGELGDVVDRHRLYAQYTEKLDIIVFSRQGYSVNQISEKATAFPTNSKTRLGYLFDAFKIGKKICQTKKIDLVITQAPFISGLVGYLLAKKFKTKLLLHFHGDYIANKYWLRESWLNRFMLPLSKFLARRADGMRVMSSGIKEKLVAIGVKAERIRVINVPVNFGKFEKFDSNRVKEIKSQAQNKKIVLFVGRLDAVKNFPMLLKAFKNVTEQYQPAVLLIIGRGQELENIKNQIQELNLTDSVKLIDQIAHDDLANYYHACDILVLSSFSESFGKVLLEVAAAKKPSVATETVGAKDIIRDGETGYLAPVDNADVFAEKIIILLKDEALSQKMGEKAFDHIKDKFNWQRNLKKMIDLWQDIIKDTL